MLRMTESGVVIQRYLAIQRQNITLLGQDQGVHLNQGGVFASVGIPKPDEHRGNLVNHGARETSLSQDLCCNVLVDSNLRVQPHAGQGLGVFAGQGFNVHTALSVAHCQLAASRAVQED